MAPIYDSDLSEQRWAQEEWKTYELWDKTEKRHRNKRRRWIMVTAALFVLLSSVPVVLDSFPKWTTLWMVRRIAVVINDAKRHAVIEHKAFRVVLLDNAKMGIRIEVGPSCKGSHWEVVSEKPLLNSDSAKDYLLIKPSMATDLGIPGLVDSYCYDSLKGSSNTESGPGIVAIAAIPAKDLTERRLDRLSILVLKGDEAEISFN